MSRSPDTFRILAFEPFDAGSHRAMRESISRHSRHAWTWITRPGRFWKWRMRTAAIEMIESAQQQGAFDAPVDAIMLTSLMSAADLRALLPEALRGHPLVLYMHENQAAYPEGRVTDASAEQDLHYPLTNLTSVLAAEKVIWNSTWNRESFLDGIQRILKFGPDLKMPGDLHDRMLAKSVVIWPPVEPPPGIVGDGEAGGVLHNVGRAGAGPERGDEARTKRAGGRSGASVAGGHNAEGRNTGGRDRPVRVVWPHRWEHDKGPSELLAIAREHTESLNLHWTILGERYRRVPQAIRDFEREFADRIDHIGFEPNRDAYWRHLSRCDWVLSTAHHEFFGIAVVEALLAGCLPWLPQRLSYPELLPTAAHGLSPADPPENPEEIRQSIREHLRDAIAPNAVGRLDAAIDSLLEVSRSRDAPQNVCEKFGAADERR